MNKVKHVLGISGGKDSAALAIYLKDTYPKIDFIYYYTDTGKELEETYKLLDNIEIYLGKKITRLIAKEANASSEDAFDYFYKVFRGYLPSATARWCTNNMKIKPFEDFVGETTPTLSYVGIRGDEDRDGYISKKSNIQAIFPFRKNIWSGEILKSLFNPKNNTKVLDFYSKYLKGKKLDAVATAINEDITFERHQLSKTQHQLKTRLNICLDYGIAEFNRTTFDFLKTTKFPISHLVEYEILENEDVLVKDDIFKLLEKSGVGVPAYYKKKHFEVEGQKGEYARSRSGCFFCFYQQKIEWVWLYEQHPHKFKEAMQYENIDESFTWNADESLEELIQPERLKQIKLHHLKKSNKIAANQDSPFLLDILGDEVGCDACFV